MTGPAGSAARAGDGFAPGYGGTSRWLDIGGPVHYVDFGGPSRGPLIVCVHGLAGSAANWSAIAPLLTSRYRVLAPDLAGHGLTRSGGRRADVRANRLLLDRLIKRVSATPVILAGNSMGGMISLLEASAAPSVVSGLILVDPALPFMPARPDPLVAAMFAVWGLPGLGRAVLGGVHRLPPEAVVGSILSACCEDPSRIPGEVIAWHLAIARHRAGFAEAGRDMAAAARSVIYTAGLGSQAYRRGNGAVTCPVLLLHGERDRLVPASAARAAVRAHRSWSLVVLPGVGHVPQLEAPRQCADAIISWLGSAGASAAQSAAPAGGRGLKLRCATQPPLARRSRA